MKNFRKCNQLGRKTLRSKGVVKPQSESSLEGIPPWSFGGGQWCCNAYNINQLKSFKLLKYLSKSKSNQKKVPLKSKIAKHSTNSSKPLVKSASLLWKHLLFIRPHAFFWGQKHTWKILLTKPRLVLSGAVLESHGQGEKQTHRMFCQVAFFSLFGVGKGSPISQIIKKQCFFSRFFLTKFVSFFVPLQRCLKKKKTVTGKPWFFRFLRFTFWRFLPNFFGTHFFTFMNVGGFQLVGPWILR